MSKNRFKNIVFEGGGVKGIAYIGALEALEKSEVISSIQRVGGTSAGAITALIVGLGIKSKDMLEFIKGKDLQTIEDNEVLDVLDVARLLTKYGWNKGEVVRKWIGDAIEFATGNVNSTFEDIKQVQKEKNFKDMYFVGTNLSTHSYKIYCHELTPKTRLIDAVEISTSIPLYFTAKTDEERNYYVDGGVLMNYPIRLFDEKGFIEDTELWSVQDVEVPKSYKLANEKKTELVINNITETEYKPNLETIGFRLESEDKILFYHTKEAVVNEINNIYDFTKHLIKTLREFKNYTYLNDIDMSRTIFLDVTGVNTTDWNISPEKMAKIIANAYNSTKTYLEKFEINVPNYSE